MKGYEMLAGRYLRQQRRRSALTVLGIVLSVALISALLTMGQALKDNYLSQQIYENGSYHFGYSKPSEGLYDRLKNHALTDRVGVKRGGGAETAVDKIFKVYVYEMNQDALSLLPIHLEKGRLPVSADEVAAEEWVVERMPGQPVLGDSVTLNAPGGGPHAYHLVGLLKNEKNNQIGRSSAAYTLLADTAVPPGSSELYHDELYVTLKKGVDINTHLEDFAKLGDPFITNNRLLTVLGESRSSGLNNAIMVIFGTLVGLVVLSTVAVIYNAIHISVLERIRQFGLLRTVGATPRQIRHLVVREASTLAAIGIPLGLAIGWGGLWLALWFMIQGGFRILQMDDFRLTFHWWIMGLSIAVGIAAVYAAAWLPARKASRVSPVEAVKGAGSIVRETYRRARFPSLLRLLGIEGQMASNNIRRNRSKFRITTFSIVITVTLFIVFHYFTQQAFKLTVDTNENNKIAFQFARYVNLRDENGKLTDKKFEDIVTRPTMDEIAALPGVEGVYGQYSLPPVRALVPANRYNSDFTARIKFIFDETDLKGQKVTAVNTNLQLYDNARLAITPGYLTAGTADATRLDAEDGVLIVQTVLPYNHDAKKKEMMELTRYKVGDTLTLQFDGNSQNQKTLRTVKIAGILSQSPFDAAYQENGITVIATRTTITKLIGDLPPENRPYGTALTGVEVALKDGADAGPVRKKLEQIALDIPGGQLIDIVTRQKEQRQFALQMQIFVYGFLAVIGLIGSLNIVNTVQTNLLLRRREFGLLQAVGMTMAQIRKMATAEGVWFGVIGSFWGLLLGGAVSYFLFRQLSGIEGIPFEFPWGGALISCVFALGVGLLSVQGPLRRMKKANVIEELREDA